MSGKRFALTSMYDYKRSRIFIKVSFLLVIIPEIEREDYLKYSINDERAPEPSDWRVDGQESRPVK